MSKEFAMVRRNVLQDACSFDDGVRLSAQHAIEALLAQPADQHQGEPVAWLYRDPDGNARDVVTVEKATESDRGGWVEIPLYAQTEDDYCPDGIVEAAIHGQIVKLPSAPKFNKDEVVCRRYELNGRVFFHYDDEPIYESVPVTVDELVKMAMLSAPVEIDERAAFERIYHRHSLKRDELTGLYFDSETRSLFDGWQARAALERKP